MLESVLESIAAASHALADSRRLRILLLLGEGELHVKEIYRRIGVPQSAASLHLGILRTAGMVESRRAGQRVFYRLIDPPPVPGAIHVSAGPASISIRPRAEPTGGATVGREPSPQLRTPLLPQPPQSAAASDPTPGPATGGRNPPKAAFVVDHATSPARCEARE